MSFEAINATYRWLPRLPEMLQELPSKGRPDHAKCALVAFLLADRYRAERGYVDESIDQIAEQLALTPRTVRACLVALDALGLWVRSGAGNRHAPAKRVPLFLSEERRPDPSPCTDPERRADPSPCEQAVDLERRVETPRATGDSPRATGQPVTSPSIPVPPSSSSSSNVFHSEVGRAVDDDEPPDGHLQRCAQVAERVAARRLAARASPPDNPARWTATVAANLRTDDHGAWWARLEQLVTAHRPDTPLDLLALAADGPYPPNLAHWRNRRQEPAA